MKFKKLYCLSLALVASLASACGGGGSDPTPTPTPTDPEYTQYIVDNTFQNGFNMDPATGFRQDDGWFPDDRWNRPVALTYGSSIAPQWQGAQHGDVYSLNDHYHKTASGTPQPDKTEDGWYIFSDESKKLGANPTKGGVYFELNTSKEYVRDRIGGESWCHLLLQQGFAEACILRNVDSVVLEMDITQTKFEDHMYGTPNVNVHACQFLMYIVCKSENAYDSASYFWFGIPFFDNRYKYLPESGMLDLGTGKYMYGMDSSEYLPNGVQVGVKNHIEIDLLPFFGRGLIMCQDAGYFTHSVIGDLTFQSMNIGFEIPGTYDSAFEITNFSLTSHNKTK